MQMPDGAVTVPEAAVRLGVSVDTVRRRVQAGQLDKVPLERGYAVVLNQQPSLEESLLGEVRAERDRLLQQVAFFQRQLEESLRAQAVLLALLQAGQQVDTGTDEPARSR